MMQHERRRQRFPGGRWLWGLGLMLCLSAAQGGPAETVDCILALVDDSPVTLSDVRIAEAFGLVSFRAPSGTAGRLRAVLEELIDRKVVVEIARDLTPVPAGRVEAALDDIRRRLTASEFESRLDAFGLGPDDLKPYLDEQLTFQEIIDQRFSQSVAVTLKEIESYYERTYVPEQKTKGMTPLPMLQVLSELEATVRNEKIGSQVDSWIRNLRAQAEVILKDECLKNLKEEEQ